MTLTDKAYKILRKEILFGAISSGARLVETQLAKKLSISRTPVREALVQLRNEGLIEEAPGGGMMVSNTSLRDAKEIVGLRRVLEGYAMEEAFDSFSDVDILQLELYVKQADLLSQQGDFEALSKLNTKFHDFILLKSDNSRLKQMLDNLQNSISRYRIASLNYPGNARSIIKRHQSIVDAIKRQDKKAAVQAVQQDVDATTDVLLALFQEESDKAAE